VLLFLLIIVTPLCLFWGYYLALALFCLPHFRRQAVYLMPTHPFHLVSPSPWPLLGSVSLLIVSVGLVFSWSNNGTFLLILGLACLTIISFKWFYNIIVESTFSGFHTLAVQSGLRLGFCLLIASEVFFFVSFF